MIEGTYNYIPYGFEEVLGGREKEYPLLARAVENITPAISTKVEWSLGKNYTEIFRNPFYTEKGQFTQPNLFPHGGNVIAMHALSKHLADVELACWDGVPEKTEFRSFMGGVRHYLGREPIDSDMIKLRPLRDLILLDHTDWKLGHWEWISEVTLEVYEKELAAA